MGQDSDLAKAADQAGLTPSEGDLEKARRAAKPGASAQASQVAQTMRTVRVPQNVVRAVDQFLQASTRADQITVQKAPLPWEIFAHGGGARRFGMVLDVSGSIDKEQLAASCSLAAYVAKRYRISLDLVVTWNVAKVQEWRREIPKADSMYHGGGTDMVKAIQYMISQGIRCLILVTDMECDWDEALARSIRLLVIRLGSTGRRPEGAKEVTWR